jgi:hypothetical protein
MTRHENISCPQPTIKATFVGGLRNGTVTIARNPAARRYLFPDTDDTVARFKEPKAHKIHSLHFE